MNGNLKHIFDYMKQSEFSGRNCGGISGWRPHSNCRDRLTNGLIRNFDNHLLIQLKNLISKTIKILLNSDGWGPLSERVPAVLPRGLTALLEKNRGNGHHVPFRRAGIGFSS